MELIDISPAPRRRQFWLEFILLLCFLACLVVGFGSLATLIWLRTDNRTLVAPASPLPSVEPGRISPALTLNQLRGDPEAALALQAIHAGEVESAWSILAYATTIDDESMLTLYQLLARRLMDDLENAAGTDEKTQQRLLKVLQTERSLAILSAPTSVIGRAQIFTQVTSDFIELGEVEEGLRSAIQLQQLAQSAPDLLPAQRNQMLEPLRKISQPLNEPDFQQRLLELSRNPYFEPTGKLLVPHLAKLASTLEANEPIAAAQRERQQASQALLVRLQELTNQLNGQPLIVEHFQAERDRLTQMLLVEDQVRIEAVQRSISETNDPRVRLALLQESHRWIVLKARIAMAGFGISLVPAWEANLPTIEQELETVVRNMDGAIEEIMDTLGTPLDTLTISSEVQNSAEKKAVIRVEKFMWLARQIERGLFPGGSAALISNELRFAQDELANQGFDLALRIVLDTSIDEPEFLFEQE